MCTMVREQRSNCMRMIAGHNMLVDVVARNLRVPAFSKIEKSPVGLVKGKRDGVGER